jgi:hypothetical protein
MLSYAIDPTPSRSAGQAAAAWAVTATFFLLLALI